MSDVTPEPAADLAAETALARRALAVFGLSTDAQLTFVKRRENIVFRVDDGDDAYALRLHRPGLRSHAETACEVTHAIALHEAGIPVSSFLAPRSGDIGEVVDDEGTTHIVDVQRWVTGSRHFGDAGAAWLREEATPTMAQFDALGELCGRMHAASQRIGRVPGFERRAWDAEGLVGERALWGDPRRATTNPADATLIGEALTRIRHELDALGTGADVFGVIHADTTPENVLVRGDGDAAELTLIDFDDFGEGFWLFDLATLLFWYSRDERADELRAALLAGYEREFPVPPQALAALDTLILARGLTYLGWAADRPGDETSEFLVEHVLPELLERCRAHLEKANTALPGMPRSAECAQKRAEHPDDNTELIARRSATLGPYSPLFYDRPLHFVDGEGAWLIDAQGNRYLDAYNNVPQVGHANPRVADAVARQLHEFNANTRYLSEPIVNYAEALLATFDEPLDRVYFTNSGSEANELALRIARHATGASGIIVADFSYHGNTITLAQLTTGLTVSEPFGAHVRAIHIPDLDAPDAGGADVLAVAFAQLDAAIASLIEAGHGVSAVLLDPAFSTEGLPRLPEGFLEGVAERVHAAGGLVIADEVQSGLGRLGDHWWGHQVTGLRPDLVTLGKPLGNGYPLGGVVTTEALLEAFSSTNMYFNTFAGTPAAASAGHAVLREVHDRGLVERTGVLGRHVAERLGDLVERHPRAAAARGRGLFFGLELVDADGAPDAALAKRIVERLVAQRILISRIGPNDNVLKIRPPLVIERDELDRVIDALDAALTAEEGGAGA